MRTVVYRAFLLAFRLYAAAIITGYALGKMAAGQFLVDPLDDEVASIPLGELTGFQMAWRFFGYSAVFVWIIGLLQLTGALLLLFNRMQLLALLFLLPVMINIVLIDLIFGIPKQASFNAIHITLILLFLIWTDRARVLAAMRQLAAPLSNALSKSERITTTLLALLLLPAFY